MLVVSDGRRVFEPVERSGDEPQLLARTLPGVPVLVCPDRHLAGVLAERRFGATVILLDDGFQHLELERDLDLLMVRPEDLREELLPHGRLREPLGAASAAHAIIVPGSVDETALVAATMGTLPGVHARPGVRHAAPGAAVRRPGIRGRVRDQPPPGRHGRHRPARTLLRHRRGARLADRPADGVPRPPLVHAQGRGRHPRRGAGPTAPAASSPPRRTRCASRRWHCRTTRCGATCRCARPSSRPPSSASGSWRGSPKRGRPREGGTVPGRGGARARGGSRRRAAADGGGADVRPRPRPGDVLGGRLPPPHRAREPRARVSVARLPPSAARSPRRCSPTSAACSSSC